MIKGIKILRDANVGTSLILVNTHIQDKSQHSWRTCGLQADFEAKGTNLT